MTFNSIISEKKDLKGLYLCNDSYQDNSVKNYLGTNNGILEGGKNTSDISIDGPNYFHKAFRFDGIQDRVNLGKLVSEVPEATILCWVRSPDEIDDMAIISADDRDGPSFSIRFDKAGYYSKGNRCFKASGTKNTTESSADSAVQNEWILTSLTRDTKESLLYINGLLDNQVSVGKQSGLTIASDLFLGYGSNGNSVKYSKVDITGVFIFTRSLSPEEILEIYNGPEPINKVLPELTINQNGTWKGTIGEWGLPEPFDGMLNGEFKYSWDLYNGNNIVSSGVGIPIGDNLSSGNYYLSVKAYNNGGAETVKSLTKSFNSDSNPDDNQDPVDNKDEIIANYKNILLQVKNIVDSVI